MMKAYLIAGFVVSALICGAVPASGQLTTNPNEIGFFTTATPASHGDAEIFAPSGAGAYPCYLLLCNATDETSGDPITTLGGFELSIFVPAGWVLEPSLPADTMDFNGQPDHFFVSGTIPVVGEFTVLAEVLLGTFGDGAGGGIYLAPYDMGVQSIPGHMAITNADAGYELSHAYPISGSYDLPVACINCCFATEDASWSRLKSLYR